MNLQNVYFAFPEAGILFFFVILLLAMLWGLWHYRGRMLKRYANPDVYSSVMVPRIPSLFFIKSLSLILAWILATLALMQPIGYGTYPEEIMKLQGVPTQTKVKRRQLHEIILLIDVSASMAVTDMREKQRRLDFAKDVSKGILNRLDGQPVALEVFTTETFPISPMTNSYFFVAAMLDRLQINEGGAEGTNLLQAFQKMRERYFAEQSTFRKTILLFSDGENTEGTQNESESIINLAEEASKNGVNIFTVGLGTKNGGTVPDIAHEGKPVVSHLNEELLAKISQQANGSYYFANDFAAINLAEEIVNRFKQTESTAMRERQQPSGLFSGKDQKDNLVHRRFFQIPLALAIVLLMIVVLCPDTWLRKISNGIAA